jgi:hypothetical protein
LKLVLGTKQYKTWRALAATAADAEEFSVTERRITDLAT